jgi:tRNA(fMet)-specific endonuclease VapC
MIKYLLDTDTCVFFLHEKFSLFEKIKSIGFENCYVSEITLAELFFGAYNGRDPETDRKDGDLIERDFAIVPIYKSLELYGKEKARLRKSGMIIPELDLLIATTAVHHNMTLVTNNTKHMTRIKGIQLENWTRAEDNIFIQ